MRQIKNSNCDNTQIVTKLKNSSFDKTLKNQVVTKLKNSNCDGLQKQNCNKTKNSNIKKKIIQKVT